jgi:hypothetical protein
MLGWYIHLVHLYHVLLLKTPERSVVRTGIEPVSVALSILFYLVERPSKIPSNSGFELTSPNSVYHSAT